MAKLKHDFTREDPWRIFRIMSEFVDGFEMLSDIDNAVSIFGASQAKHNDKYYKLAEETAYHFAKAGYAVITGAGGGIMEAANKGCRLAKGKSIGLNILIPIKQVPNRFITKLVEFRYFFCRKVMFAKYSKAFIVFPGGLGTLDEFFESVALVQTKRIEPFPIVLVGSTYWQDMLSWLKKAPLKKGYLSGENFEIFKIMNEPKKIVNFVKKYYS